MHHSSTNSAARAARRAGALAPLLTTALLLAALGLVGPVATAGGQPERPASLAGVVTDLAGHPVPGASVEVTNRSEEVSLPTVNTDAAGHWQIPLGDIDPGRVILLIVATAPGYARWSNESRFPASDVQIQLWRPPALVAPLLATATGDERRRIALELLASQRPSYYKPHLPGDETPMSDEEIAILLGGPAAGLDLTLFRVTGRILPELRQIADSAVDSAVERPRSSPAAGARWALLLWGDPQDAGRLGDLAARSWNPADTSAPTPQALCVKTLAIRIEQEQHQAEGHCSVDLIDDTGTHAMLSLSLYYPDGASEFSAVARLTDGQWRIGHIYETYHISGGF